LKAKPYSSPALREELAPFGIAVNSLWPRTAIAAAAIEAYFPDEVFKASHKPQIMADAACVILSSDSRSTTGNVFIDEEVLRGVNVSDFAQYAVTPGAKLATDLFVD